MYLLPTPAVSPVAPEVLAGSRRPDYAEHLMWSTEAATRGVRTWVAGPDRSSHVRSCDTPAALNTSGSARVVPVHRSSSHCDGRHHAGPTRRLRLLTAVRHRRLELTVVGVLDAVSAPQLDRVLRRLDMAPRVVWVDLSRVCCADVAGLRPLVEGNCRRRARRLPPWGVAAASEAVQHVGQHLFSRTPAAPEAGADMLTSAPALHLVGHARPPGLSSAPRRHTSVMSRDPA